MVALVLPADIAMSKAETTERLDSVAAEISQMKAAIFALTTSLQSQLGVAPAEILEGSG